MDLLQAKSRWRWLPKNPSQSEPAMAIKEARVGARLAEEPAGVHLGVRWAGDPAAVRFSCAAADRSGQCARRRGVEDRCGAGIQAHPPIEPFASAKFNQSRQGSKKLVGEVPTCFRLVKAANPAISRRARGYRAYRAYRGYRGYRGRERVSRVTRVSGRGRGLAGAPHGIPGNTGIQGITRRD